MDKKSIKINFVDTEKGYFNNDDNLFLDILKEHYNVEISDKPDFLFYSCFGDNYKNFSNCVKIFFTNENIIPDFITLAELKYILQLTEKGKAIVNDLGYSVSSLEC